MQEIGADRVRPMHRPPLNIIVKLIEQVILTVKINHTVRVVRPAVLHGIVILSAIRLVIIDLIRLTAMHIHAVSDCGLRAVAGAYLAGNGQPVFADFHRDIRSAGIRIAVFVRNGYHRTRVLCQCIQAYRGHIVFHILNRDRLGRNKLRPLFHCPG